VLIKFGISVPMPNIKLVEIESNLIGESWMQIRKYLITVFLKVVEVLNV